MSYVILALMLFLLYRFVTGFLLPVIRTTSQVKKQFRAMREEMERAQGSGVRSDGMHPSEKPQFDPGGEYIPFEEVRE